MPIDDHARASGGHHVHASHRFGDVAVATGTLVAGDPQLAVDRDRARAAPPARGVGVEGGHLGAELVGSPQVVVVAEGNPPRVGRGQARVARCGEAQGLLVSDDADPAVTQSGEEGGSVVG